MIFEFNLVHTSVLLLSTEFILGLGFESSGYTWGVHLIEKKTSQKNQKALG